MKAIKNKQELFDLCYLYLKSLSEVHYNHMVIEKKDVYKLLPKMWLNDTLINFYIELLKNYAKLKNIEIYAFTTFFFTKLCRNYDETVNLYPDIDLSKYDLLIFPIHKNSHWTLLIYEQKNKRLEYYDSLNGKLSMSKFKLIKSFLFDLGTKANFRTPVKYADHPECSQQQNGYDCGVFVCQFIKCKILGVPCQIKDTTSEHMRMEMLHEIVIRQIIYEPDHKLYLN